MILQEILLGLACRLRSGVILNYHTLSRTDTRAHVSFISRYFDLISHDDLLPRLRHPKGRPFCFLTFDDGKKSNATETAPVLRELGVSAGFYVPTEFLSQERRPLWFDRVAALRAHLSELPAELRDDTLKLLPLHARDQLVDDACRRHGIDADMTDDDIRPMSWDDVRALHAQGFTIGSHSEWHAILPRETLTYARTDISRSIERISTELQTRCATFSFPNGNYTGPLALHAQACGAATVFTTEPMWIGSRSQSWRLPRIQLSGRGNMNYVATKISAARVPGLLANPDGTGRRYAGIDRITRR
jgi:peptidoglycan/xylan/chitin deacetylase (PgdA/CDA1 family)